MREQFSSLLGEVQGTLFLPRLPRLMPIGLMYNSPRSAADLLIEARMPNILDLPSREIVIALYINSLKCVCLLIRFVYQPTFYKMFNKIYITLL